jgi:hypothetical protein
MPEMLTESGVLAPGSLNGFINCKNFNRCKRLHSMLALEMLHFQVFISSYDYSENVKDILTTTD